MSTLIEITRDMRNTEKSKLSASQLTAIYTKLTNEGRELLNALAISKWVAYKLSAQCSAETQREIIAYALRENVTITTTLVNAFVRAQKAFRSNERLALTQALTLNARELKQSFIADDVRVRTERKMHRYERVLALSDAASAVDATASTESAIERTQRELREQINIDSASVVLALSDASALHAAYLANADAETRVARELDAESIALASLSQSASTEQRSRKHLRRKQSVAA